MPARSDASIKRLTLVATIIGSGIVLLDGTVVNVAVPPEYTCSTPPLLTVVLTAVP